MLHFFSKICNFEGVKSCLCIFNQYTTKGKGVFGDINPERFNYENELEILALKKFCIDNKGVIHFYVFTDDDFTYVNNIILTLYKRYAPNNIKIGKMLNKNMRVFKYDKDWDAIAFTEQIKNNMNKAKITYDYIVQNPPYSGTLHASIFDKTLDLLSEDGKMVIIEPATWLINVRKNGDAAGIYADLKNKLGKHVYKVIIENYNKEFNTDTPPPFSITCIDNSKKYDEIEFHNCGYKTVVKSLYDCNLIGSYNMIHSIIDKLKSYTENMNNHIYKEGKTKVNENTYFCKYADILSSMLCASAQPKRSTGYTSDISYHTGVFGEHLKAYLSTCYHYNKNSIENKLHNKLRDENKISYNLFGTKQELENWKYFIFNNKLPLFLNLLLTYDHHNNIKDIIPWITDKTYTDAEINKLFNFTEEEIKFMDRTIKQYERQSPWFKRYMCGPTSVTNEEVQKFMENLHL